MAHPLARILFRLALCAGATYALWLKLETVAFAISAPLFGVALARPIIDLVAASHVRGKEWALQDIQGKFFEYHGARLDIAEDEEEGQRWILCSDLRKIITGLPRDEVLQRQFPDRVDTLGAKAGGMRIRADAVLEYLRKATDPTSVRFKVWLEREVIFPSRKR